MPNNTYGEIFRITTFGESHGPAVGVIVDGCPAGLSLNENDIQKELNRRKPGRNEFVSSRKEKDTVEILSGVFNHKTLGTPIALLIRNQDARPKDYFDMKNIIRPGHADYLYHLKYGVYDWRGGGRASARETACRVAAGAIAKKILKRLSINIFGYIVQIGDAKISSRNIKKTDNCFFSPSSSSIEKIRNLVEKMQKLGDSIGGVIEIIAQNVPLGWGEPIFGKMPAELAKGFMSIPGAKAFEVGNGFDSAFMKGSEYNDIWQKNKGKISTETNRCGGIIGGISTGSDIIARISLKPTSSINKEQNTIDFLGRNKKIKIEGRHDPCICFRAVPVAEAMMAITLVDLYLRSKGNKI